jgi:hypothetical protein
MGPSRDNSNSLKSALTRVAIPPEACRELVSSLRGVQLVHNGERLTHTYVPGMCTFVSIGSVRSPGSGAYELILNVLQSSRRDAEFYCIDAIQFGLRRADSPLSPMMPGFGLGIDVFFGPLEYKVPYVFQFEDNGDSVPPQATLPDLRKVFKEEITVATNENLEFDMSRIKCLV